MSENALPTLEPQFKHGDSFKQIANAAVRMQDRAEFNHLEEVISTAHGEEVEAVEGQARAAQDSENHLDETAAELVARAIKPDVDARRADIGYLPGIEDTRVKEVQRKAAEMDLTRNMTRAIPAAKNLSQLIDRTPK
jgi:hypothetical protein